MNVYTGESINLYLEGSFNDLKITADLSNLKDNNVSIVITTPFEGFNQLTLKGSVVTEPHVLVTFNYIQDDYTIQFKCKYDQGQTSLTAGNSTYTAEPSYANSTEYNATSTDYYDTDTSTRYYTTQGPNYDYEENGYFTNGNGEPTETFHTFSLEGTFNDQKIATTVSVTEGSTSTGYKFNVSADVETPFEFLRNAKILTSYEEDSQENGFKYLHELNLEYNKHEFNTQFNTTQMRVTFHYNYHFLGEYAVKMSQDSDQT